MAVPASSTSSMVHTRPSPRALRKVRMFPLLLSFALTVQLPMYGLREAMDWVFLPLEVGTAAPDASTRCFFAAGVLRSSSQRRVNSLVRSVATVYS